MDHRTVGKHGRGFQKAKHRTRFSSIDLYYEQSVSLLSKDSERDFFYKKVLWQYLKDNFV